MRFFEPLILDTYVYTDEQLEVKRIDDDFFIDLNYDDLHEKRDFYCIDMAWTAKEDKRITNISCSGELFSVRHSLDEVREMIKKRRIIYE